MAYASHRRETTLSARMQPAITHESVGVIPPYVDSIVPAALVSHGKLIELIDRHPIIIIPTFARDKTQVTALYHHYQPEWPLLFYYPAKNSD